MFGNYFYFLFSKLRIKIKIRYFLFSKIKKEIGLFKTRLSISHLSYQFLVNNNNNIIIIMYVIAF